MKRLCILQLTIPDSVSLIMVTITSHSFINDTGHFSAIKFNGGNKKKEKKKELSFDTRISNGLKKCKASIDWIRLL